ncbi:YceI family protein [Jiulongibacter sp. NS-SX5]|uniref:YceI family protein n=1 Tax=Jiulongibacter sp. NS-SX5 TaxID=3463854 RepID=UPI004058F514
MKLTRTFLAMAFAVSALLVNAQTKSVDLNNSVVKWTGKKIGGQHVGTINLKSGEITVENGKISGGEFVIDMTSIKNTDLTDEGYNQKLVGHLKSDDFFGVATYPIATFKVTSASAFRGNLATVTGDLTIKGKTEEISFTTIKKANGYLASIKVDRSKFDVKYGSNSFFDNLGDKAIDDIFELEVQLQLK